MPKGRAVRKPPVGHDQAPVREAELRDLLDHLGRLLAQDALGAGYQRQTRQVESLVPTGREGSSPSLATDLPGSSNGRTAGSEPAGVGSTPAPGACSTPVSWSRGAAECSPL